MEEVAGGEVPLAWMPACLQSFLLVPTSFPNSLGCVDRHANRLLLSLAVLLPTVCSIHPSSRRLPSSRNTSATGGKRGREKTNSGELLNMKEKQGETYWVARFDRRFVLMKTLFHSSLACTTAKSPTNSDSKCLLVLALAQDVPMSKFLGSHPNPPG